MKKLLTFFALVASTVAACNLSKPIDQPTISSELIKYSATRAKTQFTYLLVLGDTVQMVLAQDAIYITADQKKDRLYVSVTVDHSTAKPKK